MCTSPKLTLKEFDGDVTKWGTFWDSFESAIHGNPKPSAIYYLHSLIKGSAAEAKAGLALISSNYEEAVTLLKKKPPKTLTSQNSQSSVLSMFIDVRTPMLLQTARAVVYKPGAPAVAQTTRIVFDTGSQWSYKCGTRLNY